MQQVSALLGNIWNGFYFHEPRRVVSGSLLAAIK